MAENCSAISRRVLIVEDHEDSAELLVRMLTRNGHEPQVAPTLATAKDLCRANAFDVVLCDIGLPDGSGLELGPILKTESPRTMAVALTGHGMPAEVRDILQAGFHAHILKPVRFDALLELLATIKSASPAGLE